MWKVFARKCGVLCNKTTVILLDTQICYDLKEKGKIKKCKIESILRQTNPILHLKVYSKGIKRFNQQVYTHQ